MRAPGMRDQRPQLAAAERLLGAGAQQVAGDAPLLGDGAQFVAHLARGVQPMVDALLGGRRVAARGDGR